MLYVLLKEFKDDFFKLVHFINKGWIVLSNITLRHTCSAIFKSMAGTVHDEVMQAETHRIHCCLTETPDFAVGADHT